MDFSPTANNSIVSFNFSILLPWVKKKVQSCTRNIKDIVCYNQGRYIQFEYLLGLNHKELKTEVFSPSPDQDKLIEKCDDLFGFIHRELSSISRKNFHLLSNIITAPKKSNIPPRICIKVIEGDEVVGLYRDRGSDPDNTEKKHKISENTGFDSVASSGDFYLENDIPKKAKLGKYKNPRLNRDHVATYSKPLLKKRYDSDWGKCWTDSQLEDRDPEWHNSCYKSTMIIPMTLLNCDLSDEFTKKFFKNTPKENKTIWGFLCLDHPTANYFDRDIDPALGYMVADLLSLYYISAHMHTEISETVRKLDCEH